MASGYVDVEGGRLFYETAGTGPAVLLLHAGGADRRMWDQQWRPFGEVFRAVRFDFPGVGASPFPERSFSPSDHIAALLDFLDIDRAALVGISLGGAVAVDFAIEYPERTWALVAVACGARGLPEGTPDPRALESWSAAAAGDFDRAAELFMEVWCPMRTSPEVDEAIRRMVRGSIGMLSLLPRGLVRLPEWQAADRLDEIRVPTLTMWGDRDHPTLQQLAERLTAVIPGARRIVIPAADHIVPMRAPDRFTDEVLSFLHQAHSAGSEARLKRLN